MNYTSLRQRLGSDWPVLDCHVHPLACFGMYKVKDVKEDVARLVKSAKAAGISKMCVFSLHHTVPREPTPEQLREANDYVLAMREIEPDVVLPFCYVNPMYPDESVAEIDRCVKDAGMVGVKLWVAVRATDERLDPIVERAVAHDVPLLQHAWIKTTGNLPGESFPADVADMARRHPKARIIMAHMNGVGLRGLEDVADCGNIVVDTSGGDAESGMVEAAVERLGHERVVFGTDAPIRHHGITLGKVLGAGISDDAKRSILWGNMARVLGGRV